jgi:hypothetical protein
MLEEDGIQLKLTIAWIGARAHTIPPTVKYVNATRF